MLKTKVKAGNITNLSDARYCAGMGVDWLGFPVSDIDPKTLAEITGWVSGPQFVLEVTTQNPDQLLSYPDTWVQIPFSQLNAFYHRKQLIISLSLNQWTELNANPGITKNISMLVISNLSGTQESDRKILTEIAEHYDVLIDFDLCPYSIDQLLTLPISGITVSGNQEIRPGLKDYEALASVLELLEAD